MKTSSLLLFHAKFAVTLLIVLCNLSAEGALADYVTGLVNLFGFGQETENGEVVSKEFTQKIPYEVSTLDEEFISEAVKLTGVAVSELDSCQQRVVLKLKSDCSKMNDEQLAKMAVHLLNCQSYVEGREMFPCSEEMSIKQCTTNMDSDTWTSYHLMSNRAKAVCYMIRQSQFRGLAEHTVNRLMEASKDQLVSLERITTNQENILDLAENTYESLAKGQKQLSEQQKDLQKAQLHGQLTLEDNIMRLLDEKQLIQETHNTLLQMTKVVETRLESTVKMIADQSSETKVNHEELLEDISKIQKKATELFEKIDSYSEIILKQREDFKAQYQSTLVNLHEVNETVHTLVNLVRGTKQALEEKVSWILTALGGTDKAVERLDLVFSHVLFALVAMLTCAFLSARPGTRFATIVLPPVNLAMALYGKDHLELVNLILATASFVAVQMLTTWVWTFRHTSQAIGWTTSAKSSESSSYSRFNEIDKQSVLKGNQPSEMLHDDEELERNETDHYNEQFSGLTPPISRNGHYASMLPRSRSQTPLRLNQSLRSSCSARTRAGTPCKLSALSGRDFCYRHQTGDSIMG